MQVRAAANGQPGGSRHAGLVEERLLGAAILADAQDGGRGADRADGGQQLEPFGTHVLELERDDVHRFGKGPQQGRVLVVTLEGAGRDLCSRAVVFRC